MSKNLLNENQVRRFMKLAEIGSLSESFVDENIEEGGAAARVGNEDRDVGKGRMTPDRIREEEEVSEGEEVVDEGVGLKRAIQQGLRTDPIVSRLQGAETEAEAKAEAGASATTRKGVGMPKPETIPPLKTSEKSYTPTLTRGPEVRQKRREPVDEAQMRKLVHRIKARIMQENRHVQRLTHREQQVRLVEAQMARNVERNMAAQNREALTEALVHRVANRLKGSKR